MFKITYINTAGKTVSIVVKARTRFSALDTVSDVKKVLTIESPSFSDYKLWCNQTGLKQSKASVLELYMEVNFNVSN